MTRLQIIGPAQRESWQAARREAERERPGILVADVPEDGLAVVAHGTGNCADEPPIGLVRAVVGPGPEVVVTALWISRAAFTVDGVGGPIGGPAGELAGELLDAVLRWARSDTTADRVAVTAAEGDEATVACCLRHGFDGVPGGTGPLVGRAGPRTLVHRLRHDVRIGLHSGQQYQDVATARALWADAAALGYDWVSLFDHYRPPIFGPDGPCLDGPTLLAALAEATPRVRCALMVAPVGWRHPALTATIAATIDQVSGGRFELGLGVGGSDLAYPQYGIEQAPLAIRYEQLDETCHVIRLLLGGGPVDFDGCHYQLREAYLRPVPVQRRVPLVIGGIGPRRTLPLVARHADVWNCALTPPDDYARAGRTLAEHCERIGRSPHDIRQSMTFRTVICSDRATAQAGRQRLLDDVDGHGPDLPEYIAFGGAQECLDCLAPYVELGVRDFLLGQRPPVDRDTVQAFALQVAPHLRAMVAA